MLKHRGPAFIVLPLALAAAVSFASRPAGAQNKLSLDAGAAFPDGSGNGDGWGAGLRFGHEWDLALISLTPELALSYHNFSGANDPSTIAFLGGGRVAIGFVIEPSVFVHAGVGHVDGHTISHTSLAYDLGAALDLTVLPVIDFGPHLVFSGIAGDSGSQAFSWLEIGGHVTFNLRGDDRE
jgi:hypothetical protein